MLDKIPLNRTGRMNRLLLLPSDEHGIFVFLDQSMYSRGIAGVGQNLICVGKLMTTIDLKDFEVTKIEQELNVSVFKR